MASPPLPHASAQGCRVLPSLLFPQLHVSLCVEVIFSFNVMVSLLESHNNRHWRWWRVPSLFVSLTSAGRKNSNDLGFLFVPGDLEVAIRLILLSPCPVDVCQDFLLRSSGVFYLFLHAQLLLRGSSQSHCVLANKSALSAMGRGQTRFSQILSYKGIGSCLSFMKFSGFHSLFS